MHQDDLCTERSHHGRVGLKQKEHNDQRTTCVWLVGFGIMGSKNSAEQIFFGRGLFGQTARFIAFRASRN